jgi:hypothetical protein
VLFVAHDSVLAAGRYTPFAGTVDPVTVSKPVDSEVLVSPPGELIPVEPLIVTGIYTTTQVEPLGTVTVTPDATEIGPALLAFDPLGIE